MRQIEKERQASKFKHHLRPEVESALLAEIEKQNLQDLEKQLENLEYYDKYRHKPWWYKKKSINVCGQVK